MHIGMIKEERQEQLNLANGLSKIVMSYSNTQNFTESVLQELKKYVPVDWSAIAYIQSDSITLSPLSRKSDNGIEENSFTLENTPVALLVEKKHALLESDLKKSKFKNNEFNNNLIEQGLRSVVYMPLFSEREIFGTFIIGSKKVDAYKERELKLIKYTTTQLATVLTNYRSVEASKKDREALDWFKAIFHYTKTPLTPIMSSSGLLTEAIGNQVDSHLLPLAQNTDQAVHKLWQNLELFERIAQTELLQTQVTLKIVSPQDILMGAASYAHSTFAKNERSFILDLSAELPAVRTDPSRLEQLLRILLDASLWRTAKRDTISLHAYRERNELIIKVGNTGPTLTEDEKLSLSQPYNPEKVDYLVLPELSLSLAICRRIVELNGGRLWLESEIGKETIFAFSLPVAANSNGKKLTQVM